MAVTSKIIPPKLLVFWWTLIGFLGLLILTQETRHRCVGHVGPVFFFQVGEEQPCWQVRVRIRT